MGSWGQHAGSAYTQGSNKSPQTKLYGHVKTMYCSAESGNIIGRPLKVCTEAALASRDYSQFETPVRHISRKGVMTLKGSSGIPKGRIWQRHRGYRRPA